MESIHFFRGSNEIVFALPWESVASGWWERYGSPLLRKPCVAGRLGETTPKTQKGMATFEGLFSPENFQTIFFHTCHGAAKRTQKQISADGVHREERPGLRRS